VAEYFFFTLVTGPSRSLSLKLRDTRVYEPSIRALLAGLAVAEYFRDEEGQDVLLFIDNIFRFTQANSEVRASNADADRLVCCAHRTPCGWVAGRNVPSSLHRVGREREGEGGRRKRG